MGLLEETVPRDQRDEVVILLYMKIKCYLLVPGCLTEDSGDSENGVVRAARTEA